MSIVPMIIVGVIIIVIVLAIIIYPKKDTFIEIIKLKGDYKSFELEIRAKQKNDPPTKKSRSKLK